MDSFGFNAQLTHTTTFPLLGKCLQVRTNSTDVLRIAHQTFGHWLLQSDQIASSHLIAPATDTLRLDVIAMDGSQDELHPFTHRLHAHTFIASSGPNMMTAQLDRGHAIAFVTSSLVAKELHLQKQVLDTLGLLLTTQHDREPIHAGGVVWQGKAILFAGKSKAGKSTLCYACVRAGFALLAEDVVYIQRQPELGLWGHSTHIHLLPDAPRFFPELQHTHIEELPNGKTKMAVPVPNQLRFATQASLCIINRHSESPPRHSSVEPLAAEDALAALFEGVDEGFDLYPQARMVAADLLSRNRAYHLKLGSDLHQTVTLLKQI
jgi:hypothetical protein